MAMIIIMIKSHWIFHHACVCTIGAFVCAWNLHSNYLRPVRPKVHNAVVHLISFFSFSTFLTSLDEGNINDSPSCTLYQVCLGCLPFWLLPLLSLASCGLEIYEVITYSKGAQRKKIFFKSNLVDWLWLHLSTRWSCRWKLNTNRFLTNSFSVWDQQRG